MASSSVTWALPPVLGYTFNGAIYRISTRPHVHPANTTATPTNLQYPLNILSDQRAHTPMGGATRTPSPRRGCQCRAVAHGPSAYTGKETYDMFSDPGPAAVVADSRHPLRRDPSRADSARPTGASLDLAKGWLRQTAHPRPPVALINLIAVVRSRRPGPCKAPKPP